MVDVLLVLMLFFMAITSTEVLKRDPKLELAEARHAKPNDSNKQHKHEIVVNVKWDPFNNVALFALDGHDYKSVDDPLLQGALGSLHQQDPASYVVIRADRNTMYSNVSDLMGVCASAGIGTVTFAVMIGGANQQAPAAGTGGAASH